jgi:D-alanyl-D-alanine dipeptidase
MTLVSFEHIAVVDCGEPLELLSPEEFILSPWYFEKGLSPTSHLYARAGIIERLRRVQARVSPLRLKIWDPYRPRSVQRNIYQSYWNELRRAEPTLSEEELRKRVGTFVTHPDTPGRIPPHATGGAVDLTLADASGNEVDMGTIFDHFGPEAAALYYELPFRDAAIRDNRRLLRDAMSSQDFRADEEEWWHFDYGNQLWALIRGAPHACYGEAPEPKETA